MPKKESSSALSKLAAKILAGGPYSTKDVLRLAASVLSQDETKLTKGKPKKK